uniref:Uncharacterized protein n=1 Tax=Anopheles dirus TaxID=7168 RepID=A0A182N9C0_9DIPT
MSGTNIPFVKDSPPPLVPLPYCHERVKQVQARLFNGRPISPSFIASCRLCLKSNVSGTSIVTIVQDDFNSMMQSVFPFLITHQTGLPTNVCYDCYCAVHSFHIYSQQVLSNQSKLQATLVSTDDALNRNVRVGLLARELNVTTDNSQKLSKHIQTDSISTNNTQTQANVRQKRVISGVIRNEILPNEAVPMDPLSGCKMTKRTLSCSVPNTTNPDHVTSSGTAKGAAVNEILFVECNISDNDEMVTTDSGVAGSPNPKKARESSGVIIKSQPNKSTIESTERNLYKCNLCEESFNKQYQLKCHVKTHMMKVCPICKKSFLFSQIRQHILTEHP